jgi:hypothetical protein
LEEAMSGLLARAEGRQMLSTEQMTSLHQELMRTFKAFNSGQFTDYWAFRLPPNYRGKLAWNPEKLQLYKSRLPSPDLMKKLIAENKVPHPERLAGYSLKTDEETFKYGWIALSEARWDSDHKLVYCSTAWRGISPENSKLRIGRKLPSAKEQARAEPNTAVYWKPSSFTIEEFAGTGPIDTVSCSATLLISSVEFVPAYPVYIKYRYLPEYDYWVPEELAAGCNFLGIDYIF